jgi:DNA replication regulator SLD3
MNDLIDFLGTLALSTTVLDKKYKDGVTEVINDIDLGKSADEASKSRRKRKHKKMKPGKNGLYPMEEDLLQQWWESQDADADPSGETLDDKAKRRINQLRIRETQLQMIVILEALALLPLASHDDADETLPSATAKESQPGDKESRKLKKPRDLSELLEIHVDRLCIWQSVAAEGRPTTSTKHDSTSQMTSSAPQKVAADVLREFCTEVIVPL